jgi:hypothetical protein
LAISSSDITFDRSQPSPVSVTVRANVSNALGRATRQRLSGLLWR